MGIPRQLFFQPGAADKFRMVRYGQLLETPVGVAAGPHTQLAVNLIAAWLCGARYMELKTVQTLDELEVSKPCIDMQDEGYNCEWSQELKIRESFTEYLNGWIIIHILRKELGFDDNIGTIFNMSVGYNMEGILNDNVQWFLAKMADCSEELAAAKASLRDLYPAIDDLKIPARISDNITLSTMHGCPPGEIEKIGLYLIREKKLHTTIKLNPTLLGSEELNHLLNIELGFSTVVPDIAFEHDLKYPDALKLIASLEKAALENGVCFGVKLTNTLESVNNKDIFSAAEKMMYMSGRALHPISVRVARKLQHDLEGRLDISFSAGADCFNLPDLLACGMKPVTVCSDLLKPGGYGRLHQYFDVLTARMDKLGAGNLDDLILRRAAVSGSGDKEQIRTAMLKNLYNYAGRVAANPAYHKDQFSDPSIKTTRPLGWFDCIHSPCADTCPTHQDIPEYMHQAANGDTGAAFETIMRKNPFPSVTGMICDHLCQLKCTRINYDEPVRIREVKRYVAETHAKRASAEIHPAEGKRQGRFAVIGAGPAGLSCAWFLKQAGGEVDIYEQKTIPGGMVSSAIPAFRLTKEAIDTDIHHILSSGINLHDRYLVNKENFREILDKHDAVFLAAGAQRSAKLSLPGIDAAGVLDPLQFLFDVRGGGNGFSGKHVVIIGGGNTAKDAARTAFRLTGKDGSVTIVYRRTIREMPADHGEIKAVMEEGVGIMEQVVPLNIIQEDGKITALRCCRTVLSQIGNGARPVPVNVPGSEFEIPCDTIIPAIGQEIAFDFIPKEALRVTKGQYSTANPKIFIGGDALRGASTAINAIGDGRKAAIEMLDGFSDHSSSTPEKGRALSKEGLDQLMVKKATRGFGNIPEETSLENRRNFDLVMAALSDDDARAEASRCLQCDVICNVCVSVCPNLANYGYRIDPVNYTLQKAVLQEDGTVAFVAGEKFTADQPFQVLNIRDLCNECGNCTTFCPSSGKPFSDKPGLCLSVESLNREGSGFFLSRLPGAVVLIFKEEDHVRTLALRDGLYTYETDQVRAVINPGDFSLVSVEFLTPCVREFHFNFAAEMSIVLKGAMELL